VPETTTATEGALIGGRYRLVSKLARGGMAEVWEAKDEVLSRPVAVKALLPHLVADEAFHARFHREALAAARLSHPHIVSIYDTCSSEDFEAIVMELVRGSTLRQVLDSRGALPPRRAVSIARQVADALGHAHAGGLVHRDVKPGNILLADDGRVLVTDFGIAKAVEDVNDLTDVGQIVGTAKYLSPEQVQGGGVDARTDLYALGVVLYEMLCGRPPFSGDSPTATALARLTTEPLRPRQVRAGISRSLEDVVLKAMARSPEARFATAADLCAALDGLDLRVDDDDDRIDRTIASAPAVTDDATPAPSGALAFAKAERSWVVPAALILVIALVLGVVGLVLGRTEVGRDLFDAATGGGSGATATGDPLTLGAPRSHDPEGTGGEGDDTLELAVDGNPDTAWTTESYRTRALGGLKDGVGIIVPLAAVAELHELRVTSPTVDWSAEVFVAASGEGDWGAPITSKANIPAGEVTFDLGGVEGGAVLLWITDLGDGSVGRDFEVAVSEVVIS
jgi:hypothetical protein